MLPKPKFYRNLAGIIIIIHRMFPGIQNPDASGRIRMHPGRIRDASGIGISSAGVCIWSEDPILASSSARPAAALCDLMRSCVNERLFFATPFFTLLSAGFSATPSSIRTKQAPSSGCRRRGSRIPTTWGICTRRACKLNRARSQLYRSQLLQENMSWKALAEIYPMRSFAPFSKLNFLFENR